jgi:hypothetical protein
MAIVIVILVALLVLGGSHRSSSSSSSLAPPPGVRGMPTPPPPPGYAYQGDLFGAVAGAAAPAIGSFLQGALKGSGSLVPTQASNGSYAFQPDASALPTEPTFTPAPGYTPPSEADYFSSDYDGGAPS